MGIIEQKDPGKGEDSNVDITKLSYTDDYKSYLSTKETAASCRLNMLQYFRFMAIIAILESITLDNFIHNDITWVAV